MKKCKQENINVRENAIDLSVRPSVRYQSCKRDILETNEPILLQIDKLSTDKIITFWVRGGQGHTTSKLDPKTWRSRAWTHHS